MEMELTLWLSRRRALAASLLAIPELAPRATLSREQTGQRMIDRVVHEAIAPVMEKNRVPGIAVAVTVQGKRSLFNCGVASKESGQRVTEDTLFEIGSLSKTFTATLACLAQARGDLVLSDMASKYLPALAGTSFDAISLLELATYTAGGLPLQFPDNVIDRDQMIAYFKRWRPIYAPGTHRLYSNPSMGLFGYLAARSLRAPFGDLMERQLFPGLGLTRTYLKVPRDQMGNYAFGYAKDDRPIRVQPGVFDSEAYGVKTTATDMIRFVEANINAAVPDVTLHRAIAAVHTGYFKDGDMTQGLGWEMYAWPTGLDRLLAGNSSKMILETHAVTRLAPRVLPQQATLINKTGSTNGFGSYAAFVPRKRLGIVILANRSFPIADRVTAAYKILRSLSDVEK
jgi:beta-lactamase class C